MNKDKDTQGAIDFFRKELSKKERRKTMYFCEFLELVKEEPQRVLRNVFQLYHDMVKSYIGEGVDEYPGDPESIGFIRYDCSKLLEEGMDNPFFADRLFANRFVRHVESLRQGTQQNRIYIYEGPHGCGKSTFLNNIIKRFEEYTETKAGQSFELFWLLDEDLIQSSKSGKEPNAILGSQKPKVEVLCPSHDHPILLIPRKYRPEILNRLITDKELNSRILIEKEYEWIFKEEVCTICKSLFWTLFDKFGSLDQILNMVRVRPIKFDRSLGDGITVFNPGDKAIEETFVTNEIIQRRLNNMFGVGNSVKYLSSRIARANNGIYALMDIKSHNKERLLALHNVISDGVHKVGDIEERVNALFIALMNPEDKKDVEEEEKAKSFQQRIMYIKVPYVMEPPTEVRIYRNIFGEQVDERFLPRVLENFARVIVSTRLSTKSKALTDWVGDLKKYKKYCDEYGLLLRMEIYSGVIPTWLSDEDKKKFTADRRRSLVAEAEKETFENSFSGRESIALFGDFLSRYGNRGNLINMNNVCDFFKSWMDSKPADSKLRDNSVLKDFLGVLLNWYDFTVLNEVKEALYYYNDKQISEDILNFLHAVNYDLGTVTTCSYTGKEIEVSKEFLRLMVDSITAEKLKDNALFDFVQDIQQKYIETMTQEVQGPEGKKITDTDLYRDLFRSYVRNIKEKALEPFLRNENFRAAVKAFQTDEFRTFDARMKERVEYMVSNLVGKYHYTEQGAKEICLYTIDGNLSERFAA